MRRAILDERAPRAGERDWGRIALRLAAAKETLACSYLSLALLLGLAANAAAGWWWWADPVAALAMAPWLAQEGREGLRGKTCGG